MSILDHPEEHLQRKNALAYQARNNQKRSFTLTPVFEARVIKTYHAQTLFALEIRQCSN